jgi:hypothetical protein
MRKSKYSEHQIVGALKRPEDTLLYQIVARHYPALAELIRAQGRSRTGRARISRCQRKWVDG